MRILAAAFALGLLLPAAAAARPAPLPPFWTTDDTIEDDSPEPRRPLRGVYGRGIADPAPATAADFEARERRPVCAGDAAAQEAWLERLGGTLTQFWFYGTRSQAVLFRRTVRLPSPTSCGDAPVHSYHVERGFIADGLFHELEETETGTRTDTRRIGSREPDLSGGFAPFYAMATRDMEDIEGRREGRRIAGVPASCRSNAFAYIGSEVCLARRGPARGLPLLIVTQDDSQILFSTEFVELIPEAELDPRLFELFRVWRPQPGPP